MSLRGVLAALLSSSFFFSGFAAAGVVMAPDCDASEYAWTSNSRGQSACVVTAYLMSACNEGSFTINRLSPGTAYTGPSGGSADDSDLCKCNGIAYSLLSACAACQGSGWISWTDYSANCTQVMDAMEFPYPVPPQINVPYWAIVDVPINDTWSPSEAQSIGGQSPLLCPLLPLLSLTSF
ncbi:hypothetical protein DFH94DRAFT_93310 [Russula ochroleuca]|uniref:Uncharacterized protein n=1 Tax=Russula ochroleuca TaxID=152965 RepID=A0A9P5MSP8_9AGAM|nr:hypothetical protein DFH94DRAFT_93310 [Russula ochroleuca]